MTNKTPGDRTIVPFRPPSDPMLDSSPEGLAGALEYLACEACDMSLYSTEMVLRLAVALIDIELEAAKS